MAAIDSVERLDKVLSASQALILVLRQRIHFETEQRDKMFGELLDLCSVKNMDSALGLQAKVAEIVAKYSRQQMDAIVTFQEAVNDIELPE
jgi:hypothetical protein